MEQQKFERAELSKAVGKTGFFSLAFGAMIGVGWVTAMGAWLMNAGPVGAVIAFVLGGLLMMLIGVCYAEVTAALPLSGGEVAYAYKAFGIGKAFIVGWYLVFGYLSVSAFEAVSVSKVIGYLIPSFDRWPLYELNGSKVYITQLLLSAFFVSLITYINYRGVKHSARFQVFLTIAFVTITLLFVIAGCISGSWSNVSPSFAASSSADIMTGVAVVFVTVPFWFVGFDTIPQAAEEAREDISFKTIGKLILISIVCAVVFYVLLILSTAMAAPWQLIVNQDLPTAYAFQQATQSSWLVNLVLVAALVGLLTSWNGFFLAGSRVLFALGRGRIIAPAMGVTHSQYKTPYYAVAFSGAITFLASLMGEGAMLAFVNVGSLCIAAAFLGVSFSFLQLKKQFPLLKRPFKAPGGRLFGWLSIVGSVFILLVMVFPYSPAALSWPLEWLILGALSILGLVFWLLAKASRKATSTVQRNYLILEKFV